MEGATSCGESVRAVIERSCSMNFSAPELATFEIFVAVINSHRHVYVKVYIKIIHSVIIQISVETIVPRRCPTYAFYKWSSA